MAAPPTPADRINLPEPAHGFSRWAGATATALWALGVQSFPDPWSKFTALLSPGLGYLAGWATEHARKLWSNYERRNDLRENDHDLDQARQEREALKGKYGPKYASLQRYDELIQKLETRRITLLEKRGP